jgi:hypothetical protein
VKQSLAAHHDKIRAWPAPPPLRRPCAGRATVHQEVSHDRRTAVAGGRDAAEVYAAALVPAVFAPWAPLVVVRLTGVLVVALGGFVAYACAPGGRDAE